MSFQSPIPLFVGTKIKNVKPEHNTVCRVPISTRIGIPNAVIPLIFFISGLTLPPPPLAAQVSQPALYEHPHKSSDHEFIVISMGEQGIALIRDTDKFEDSKKIWEVIVVDSTLNELWNTKIQINQRLNILGHDYRDGNVYLIFEEPENIGRRITITELLCAEKTVKHHEFKPELNIRYTHFSVLRNKAIFAGYFNKEPNLLMYDLTNESTKVIPGFFNKVELLDVRNNSNDTFNVLLAERDTKSNRKLVVRTFDLNGVMLVEDVVTLEEDKTILEAMTSTLVHDDLAIIGTWTFNNNKMAAGIFSVMVDPFNEQKVNYYDFASLNHFLDYMKPKKAAKIKAKAEFRKSEGKPPEFKVHVYAVRIDENKEGFTLLSEVYDPPANYYNLRNTSPYGNNPYNYYNPYPYSPYGFNPMPYRYYNSPYGYPYSTGYANLNDTRMLHTSLLFFNNRGKLVTDQGMKFPEIKLISKEQVSDYIRRGNQTVMVSKQEKEILVQVNEQDGAVVESEKIKPALKDSLATVRSASLDNSGVRFWYGRNFYVYGYHTIKGNTDKASHDVFFINKIKVD